MSMFGKIYLRLYLLVYALYAYFNKGIAYSYLVEFLLLVGIGYIILNLKKYQLILNNCTTIVLSLLIVNTVFIGLSLGKWPIKDIAQDALIFYYSIFIFIIFSLNEKFDELKNGLYSIYKYYPLVAIVSFLLVSYVPFCQKFVLFEPIPLFLYKFGDMAIHLLITTILLLTNQIKIPLKYTFINNLIIAYLFLVIAAYNRAGLISYLFGLLLFLLIYRGKISRHIFISYSKIIPIFLIIVFGLYFNTRTEENFQGRKVGFAQLEENIISIFSSDYNGSLQDNKLWRLAWWGAILSDAVDSKNVLIGKGLGFNLSENAVITIEDQGLRSPHNIHLTILARFGFIVLLVWFVWIYLHVSKLKYNENVYECSIIIILLSFLLNASFDVYLEGPMGAFPFWTWTGILYLSDFKNSNA